MLNRIIDVRFPLIAPKIYVRSKLKHNLFDVRDQVIELEYRKKRIFSLIKL